MIAGVSAKIRQRNPTDDRGDDERCRWLGSVSYERYHFYAVRTGGLDAGRDCGCAHGAGRRRDSGPDAGVAVQSQRALRGGRFADVGDCHVFGRHGCVPAGRVHQSAGRHVSSGGGSGRGPAGRLHCGANQGAPACHPVRHHAAVFRLDVHCGGGSGARRPGAPTSWLTGCGCQDPIPCRAADRNTASTIPQERLD